jgi:transcription initiation factor TFIIIB Brf1 subunit/transcription initiation factor TFIIB
MIIKNKLIDNFSIIPNSLIEDSSISAGAIRVYLYLASRSADWNVFNKQIMKALNIKKQDTLSKYWKELINTGWISRTQITNSSDGVVGAFIYELNEVKMNDAENIENTEQNKISTKMRRCNKPQKRDESKKNSDEFKKFIEELSRLVNMPSKVKEMGEEIFNTINDKQLLKESYIKHQLEKSDYAKSFVNYMKDFNTFHSKNISPAVPKVENKYVLSCS